MKANGAERKEELFYEGADPDNAVEVYTYPVSRKRDAKPRIRVNTSPVDEVSEIGSTSDMDE